MHGVYDDLGTIAAACIAAGDAIDATFIPGKTGSSYGFRIVHRGSRIEVTHTGEGGRYRVVVDFTPSVILAEGYDGEDLSNRADLDLEIASDDQIEQAVGSMLRADLHRAEEQVDALIDELEQELSPIDSRYTNQTFEDTDIWNGFLFYDYLYPREDDFSTTRYREVVDTVYQEATIASQLARDRLDILHTDSSEGVGTDEPVTDEPSPAFH